MESGRRYPIFVGSTKQSDMFLSISWLQFSAFIFIVLLICYGYLGRVYYRAGMLVFFINGKVVVWLGRGATRQAIQGPPNDGEAKPASLENKEAVGPVAGPGPSGNAKDATGKQVVLRADTEVDNKPTEVDEKTADGEIKRTETDAKAETDAAAAARVQASEKVIIHLKEVMGEAVATGLARAGIEERLRRVLAGCQALRGTEYETSINSFIEQNCRAFFAVILEKADLQRLWGDVQQEQTLKTSTI